MNGNNLYRHIRNEKSKSITKFDAFITESLKSIFEEAARAAQRDDASILITGETGTGKEVLARHIKNKSPRNLKPYVEVNIGSDRGDLINSDLFGHVKGSFTGAVKNREGYFSKAHGGTIFLDEIGDASIPVQTNLLRVLQEGTFYPTGSDELITVDTRIISATNANLSEKILNGTFREDLYYRISDFEIELPPIRSYPKTELKEILQHFLKKAENESASGEVLHITDEAWDILLNYEYKGNYREVQQIVKRICILKETIITPDSLKKIVRTNDRTRTRTMKEIKYYAVIDSLKRNENNKANTAKELRITHTTLNNILKKDKPDANN